MRQTTLTHIDEMQMENLSDTTNSPSPLRKAAAFIVSAALIGLILMFSALLFAVVLSVGAVAWGYLWWKTRDLRKQMRQHPMGDVVIEGEIIEGEVIEGEVIREVNSGYGDKQ